MYQERAATHIQRYLRVLCSKQRVRMMIDEVIEAAKTYVAMRLQAEYRRHKGR
jgi:hypothetical protein